MSSDTKARKKVPPGLSPDAERLWNEITSTWSLNPEGMALLVLAVQARTRMDEADKVLRADGLMVTTGRGGKRAHPLLRARREAETSFMAALRAIGLES